ncbi:hypothetical protein NDU88_011347 [Pleurodeles waltl]|uniref:Uncharacterized protein n=1 Tax=Pleurodeles waltl TaxID=8319 RepID=A0AAV7S549_PLEWA|nr:hypothetical protein NDU88_011347 [Pleurodeles waltl]
MPRGGRQGASTLLQSVPQSRVLVVVEGERSNGPMDAESMALQRGRSRQVKIRLNRRSVDDMAYFKDKEFIVQ